MKFSISGKVYDAADLAQLSLRDILLFEQQTKDMGREITWAQVGVWADEIDALKTDAEKLAHPATAWMTAVTIWASRRLAGEQATFEEAVDFPLSQLTYLPEPQDRKKPNPTKARPGRGSGRAAGTARARAAAGSTAGSTPTSGGASTAG